MQLEVVRPDESTNQDQLQEAAVGTSVIVIIVICSIVGVTIIFLLFFFVRLSLFVVVGSLFSGLAKGRRVGPWKVRAWRVRLIPQAIQYVYTDVAYIKQGELLTGMC